MPEFEAIYGTPPAELVTVARSARQFSPLMPGAEALEDCPARSLPNLAILAPPGTVERNYVFALGLKAVTPGGAFVALAPNDKGGARIARELRAFGCDPETDSRRHHRICNLIRPDILEGIDAAIAAGALQKLADEKLWTQPGVFSWNRIDPGSALLASMLPGLSGKGVDLGCGIGYLALKVLTVPQVTALSLVDIDRRAIDAARRNITDPRAQFIWADARDADLGRSLDFVVMNPPFHDGGTEDRALGRAFVSRAADLLRRGGVCWLVANRHLPYEDVLKEKFTQVDQRADQSGFKIFEAVK